MLRRVWSEVYADLIDAWYVALALPLLGEIPRVSPVRISQKLIKFAWIPLRKIMMEECLLSCFHSLSLTAPNLLECVTGNKESS